MDEIKLCKNCKHERRDPLSYVPLIGTKFRTFSKCGHPNFVELDTVTGEAIAKSYCTVVREYKCEEAKFFEQK